MPGGIIDQKKIFRKIFFLPKNGYFFLKKPFLTTKRASRDAHFGPKLPPDMNKICVKFFWCAEKIADVPKNSMSQLLCI